MASKTKSKSSNSKSTNVKTPGGPNVGSGSVVEPPITSAAMGQKVVVPAKAGSAPPLSAAKKKRKEEMELRRQQAEQARRTVLFIGAIGVLVVIVVGIFLASRPLDTTFPSDLGAQYAGIPTGTTTVGPKGAYPVAYPYLGSPNAPVKIEEIGSFSCPFCLQYHDDHYNQIMDELKAGRAQFIFMLTSRTGDFDAVPGSEAAICAMQQGQFWPMHDILFDWQKRYGRGAADRSRLEAAAQKLGLDMGKFDSCMTDPQTAQYVVSSSDYVGTTRGMLGTPSIFVFSDGQQIQPPPDQVSSSTTPGSVAGLSIGNLRGIIEAAIPYF
ncbi:MAG: DsbA family protein [Aggregatilineales bacterium]